ncbi:hypothetical protein DNTS_016662 [Danionella cerebrum]|uniref:Uncharacterized protein n=1 Tax=Danionella cerebrum TaxID=2873325 RepID=A0A553R9K2_9TELE|nr:hypothetical protein DNTS_016662 [Danionella translucida]
MSLCLILRVFVVTQAPPDFQQHHQGNFGPPLHSLVSQEQWRGPPQPHHNQDRFFPGEPPFPSPHMFDQPGPPALLNNSILGLSGQGPPSFPPQGALGGSGYGPMGLGQNQGPPSLSMQHPGPPGHPGSRGFVGHRQPFSPPHQGPPFSPPHIPYGVQVRHRVSDS